jgi:hypothetical protein
MSDEPVVTTDEQLEEVLGDITFVNTVIDFHWKFEYKPCIVQFFEPGTNRGGVMRSRNGWTVQCSFKRPDTDTGEIGIGRGREELIWQGTTISGVVKTAWLLIDLVLYHEAMEGYRWKNKRIFNPHHSVYDLTAAQRSHDRRISQQK